MPFNFFGKAMHKSSPLEHLTKPDAVFLDVRATEEVDTISFPLKHHIPVLHIPLHELPERTSEIPKDKTIGTFCPSGARAAMAYLYLRTMGFENVRILEGGYNELIDALKPGTIFTHLNKNK